MGMPWGGGDVVLGSSPMHSTMCGGISFGSPLGGAGWHGQGEDARAICKAKGTRGKGRGQGQASFRSAISN